MGYISVRNAHKEFMKDGEPLTINKKFLVCIAH